VHEFESRRLTAIVAAAFTAPALAHHSFAMFDAQKTVTLQGTVKEFEWVNLHVGMRADSVKAGDVVSVTFHPMKDGTRGGQFIQAVLPGGKEVIRANARDENENQ
jgi:hypothetical protein